jgi:hypothetical protein
VVWGNSNNGVHSAPYILPSGAWHARAYFTSPSNVKVTSMAGTLPTAPGRSHPVTRAWTGAPATTTPCTAQRAGKHRIPEPG